MPPSGLESDRSHPHRHPGFRVPLVSNFRSHATQPEARSPEQDASSPKPATRSREPETGSPKPGAESREPEAPKPEA